MIATTTTQKTPTPIGRSPRVQRPLRTERLPPDPLVALVGTRIRTLRLEQGLTLRAFGQRAGVHPFHVMAIELGQLAANSKTLRSIASGLGVTSADLLNHGAAEDDAGQIAELLRLQPALVPVALARVRLLNVLLAPGLAAYREQPQKRLGHGRR